MEKRATDMPYAASYGSILYANTTILIRDYARKLRNYGVVIGQKEMFQWLSENKFIYRDSALGQWIAYKAYITDGIFVLKETPYITCSGSKRIGYTIQITGRGQMFFYEKLKEKYKSQKII